MFDMVYIGFVIIGNVVVNNMVELIYIQIMGCNICSDQNIKMVFFQFDDGFFVLVLFDCIVNGFCMIVLGVDFFGYFVGVIMGVYKYNYCIEVLGFQVMAQCFLFLMFVYQLVVLFDVFYGGGFCYDVYMFGVFQVFISDVFNWCWYGCRE